MISLTVDCNGLVHLHLVKYTDLSTSQSVDKPEVPNSSPPSSNNPSTLHQQPHKPPPTPPTATTNTVYSSDKRMAEDWQTRRAELARDK